MSRTERKCGNCRWFFRFRGRRAGWCIEGRPTGWNGTNKDELGATWDLTSRNALCRKYAERPLCAIGEYTGVEVVKSSEIDVLP